MSDRKSITVDALIEKIPEVTAFVDKALEAHECGMKAQMQMDIAVDEIFGNIANYAYPESVGQATVEIEINPETREALLTFTDHGIPFDPLAKPDPDVTLSLEDREIGGLGIFMVKKSMDDMQYAYRDGANILMLRKKI